MHLIEILLPLTDNRGKPFEAKDFEEVRNKLIRKFGGLTAFTRSPAKGTTEHGGTVVHDEIIVFEVMTDDLESAWWSDYRSQLERKFSQKEIVIRASEIQRL
jgi:hypothetical protein